MKIQCEAMMVTIFGADPQYTCQVSVKQIFENDNQFHIENHSDGKANTDITAIWFVNCKMLKIPQNFVGIFPNVKEIFIDNCGLRSLCKNDLIKFKTFRAIYFYENNIDYLPGDLFENFQHLEIISFVKNNLKFIEPNILDGLDKLKFVGFTRNQYYNIKISDPERLSNEKVEEFKNTLFKTFYSRFKFTKALKQSNENLNFIVQKLYTELEKKKIENLELTKKLNQKGQNEAAQITQISATTAYQSFLQSANNLTADLKKLTQDETFKDFKIIIDDREFPVHKFLLAARSLTLAEMLRNNPDAENLKLVDIPVEVFEIIMKFLYTDELPREDGANFLQIFAAAGRLKIKELTKYSGSKLYDEIRQENMLEVLNLSNKYGHNELRQKAFDEIKKNYPKIDFKDEWIKDGEKLGKFIEAFKIREELMRKAEEEFQKMLI